MSEDKRFLESIVMVGGGGHSRVVVESLTRLHTFSEVVIVDPKVDAGSYLYGCRVYGDDSKLPELYREGFRFAFIGVGSIRNSRIRHDIDVHLSSIGFALPVIVDESAIVAGDSQLESGVYVGKSVTINSGVKIGKNAIINTGAIVEHDVTVGKYVHVAVGAIVCGGCTIEDDVFIGAGATVIQGINIGNGAIVGAGSIILKDVPDNTMVTGVWNGNRL